MELMDISAAGVLSYHFVIIKRQVQENLIEMENERKNNKTRGTRSGEDHR